MFVDPEWRAEQLSLVSLLGDIDMQIFHLRWMEQVRAEAALPLQEVVEKEVNKRKVAGK